MGREYIPLSLLWEQWQYSNIGKDWNNVFKRVRERKVMEITGFQLPLLFATIIYMLNAL